MDQSSSTPNTLPPCDQQNVLFNAANSQNLKSMTTSVQHIRQNPQENDRQRLRNGLTEAKGTKVDRRNRQRGNENSENRQDSGSLGARSTEKILKDKLMQMENEQNLKRGTQLRTNGILTERPVNVNIDNQNSRVSSVSQNFEENQTKRPLNSKGSNQKIQDENTASLIAKKDPLTHAMKLRKLQKYSVKQLLHISKSKINFGKAMPGQIHEESLDIVNKTNQDFVVQIALDCENHEFQDTEEYVFSIRRSHLYDFNDKHYLIMAAYSSASFKITLKAPNVNKECDNKGYADISIQGLRDSFKVVLESTIKVPRVVCPKSLYHQGVKCSMIKLAAKEGKKQEYKLPFRNEGDLPLTVEFSFHNPTQNNQDDATMDCSVYPQVLTLQPNGTGFLNFSTRIGQPRLKDRKPSGKKEQGCYARKVLLGKVKDTNLFYSYFFWVETY